MHHPLDVDFLITLELVELSALAGLSPEAIKIRGRINFIKSTIERIVHC